MKGKDFAEVVDLIVREDSRYDRASYFFVRRALDYTLKKLEKGRASEKSPHVSGRELLEGLREYALEQYGPMTDTLFQEWGIRRSADFGNIVFNLIEYEVFAKTDSDRREDFDGVYDFRRAFVTPFLPPSRKSDSGVPCSKGDTGLPDSADA